MSDDLAKRVAKIEDRFAIQDVRHTYWLSIVERDVPTMLTCYAQDAHSEFGFGIELKGMAEIKPFYEKMLGDNPDLIVQVPQGTNGLIKFVDDDNATGSWLINVAVVKKGQDKVLRNNVRYHEKYKRENGAWKISYQKVDFLFFEQTELVNLQA